VGLKWIVPRRVGGNALVADAAFEPFIFFPPLPRSPLLPSPLLLPFRPARPPAASPPQEIQNRPEANQKVTERSLMNSYMQEIRELRTEVDRLKGLLSVCNASPAVLQPRRGGG